MEAHNEESRNKLNKAIKNRAEAKVNENEAKSTDPSFKVIIPQEVAISNMQNVPTAMSKQNYYE